MISAEAVTQLAEFSAWLHAERYWWRTLHPSEPKVEQRADRVLLDDQRRAMAAFTDGTMRKGRRDQLIVLDRLGRVLAWLGSQA